MGEFLNNIIRRKKKTPERKQGEPTEVSTPADEVPVNNEQPKPNPENVEGQGQSEEVPETLDDVWEKAQEYPPVPVSPDYADKYQEIKNAMAVVLDTLDAAPDYFLSDLFVSKVLIARDTVLTKKLVENLPKFSDLPKEIFDKLVDAGHYDAIKNLAVDKIFEGEIDMEEVERKVEDEIVKDYGERADEIKKMGKGIKERIDDAFSEENAAPTEDVDNKFIKELVGQPRMSDNVIDEEIRPYIEARRKVNNVIENKAQKIKERVQDPNIDDALDAIVNFEKKVILEEEERLWENMKGDNKLIEGAKKGWRWLGDQNLASFMQKYGGYEPKDTFGGKVKHGLLRSVSLRTATTALLFPLATPVAGAVGGGALVSAGIVGLFRGAMGASAGHAFTKTFLERRLRGKIHKLPDRADLKKENYEQVIETKKEYDALIKNYHIDTATDVRSEGEYEKIEGLYREAIKGLCDNGMDAEKVRMKQNLGETRARNTIKRNKLLLFSGAVAGGVLSGVVTPKLSGWARDWVGGLPDGAQEFATDSDLDSGKKTSQDTSTTKKSGAASKQGGQGATNSGPEAAPTEAADSSAKTEDLSGTETDDANNEQALPENPTSPEAYIADPNLEDLAAPENADADLTRAGEEPSRGSEDPASSEDTNTGSTEATEEAADRNPERPASAENTPTDSAAEAEETPTERTREFVLEGGFYTVQEGDSLSKIWLAANGGDVEQMTAAMGALEKLEGSPEGVEQLRAFGIDSGDVDLIHPQDRINITAIQEWLEGGDTQVDADTTGEEVPSQQTSAPEAEESAADADNEAENEGGGEEVAESAAEEQGEGAAEPTEEEQESASPAREDLGLPEGAEVVEHTASSGENTVAKVLMHRGYDINNIPEEILWQEVHEGHAMDIHLTEDGQFLGVTVDGKDLMDESALQRAADPNVAEQKGGSGERGEKVTPLIREDLGLPEGAEVLQHTVDTGENTVAKVLMHRGYDINNIPEEILWQEVHEGHAVDIYLAKDGQFLGVAVDGKDLMDESALQRAAGSVEVGATAEMSVGETLPLTGNFATLLETAETLNAGVEGVQDRMFIASSDGMPMLPAADLEHLRPDLFASEREFTGSIVRGDDGAVLVQTDYTPQKRFFIETNHKTGLNHEYVQKEFETIEKTLEKPNAVRAARQEVIKDALYALAIEKPPADATLFNTLAEQLSTAIEGDTELTERMFSERGRGDERIRVAYSESKGLLEVQEHAKVQRALRSGGPTKRVWKTVLTEVVQKG